MYPLPTEILLEIFQWASGCYYPHRSYVHYTPFQIPNDHAIVDLSTTRSLSMVCRQWRQLTAQFFYKSIWIRHGAKGLKQALQTAKPDGGTYADCVERAILPFASTAPDLQNFLTHQASINVLEACPHLRILVRPYHRNTGDAGFDFVAQTVFFPSLERLEWWYHNEAERSGGINSLRIVLDNAPNLTHLSIRGMAHNTRRIGTHTVSLPKLTSLRLHLIDPFLLYSITNTWSLPALSHVILDAPGRRPPLSLQSLWQAFGSQLRTVELGRHLRFLLDDTVSSCVQSCPTLEALNFFVFFTACPNFVVPHIGLRRIGLHAAHNAYHADSAAAWTLLDAHFDILLGDHLPFLQYVVLHGNWTNIVANPRFESILQRAQTVRRCIIYPNESPVSH